MDPLRARHLTTLKLDVGFDAMVNIGKTAQGLRRVAPIRGGTFAGERLSGVVLPGGADWVVNRADGPMVVDVRLTLKTNDGAHIYLSYGGLFRAGPEAMQRFNRGAQLAPEEYTLRTVARFETGSAEYFWLNDMIAIGVGQQTAMGPIYDLHEIL